MADTKEKAKSSKSDFNTDFVFDIENGSSAVRQQRKSRRSSLDNASSKPVMPWTFKNALEAEDLSRKIKRSSVADKVKRTLEEKNKMRIFTSKSTETETADKSKKRKRNQDQEEEIKIEDEEDEDEDEDEDDFDEDDGDIDDEDEDAIGTEEEEEEIERDDDEEEEEEDGEEVEVDVDEEEDDEEDEEEIDDEEDIKQEDDEDDIEIKEEEDEPKQEEQQQQQQEEAEEEEEEEEQDDDKDEDENTTTSTFDDLNLSRPLQRACNRLGYRCPTPIQERCIPLALMGKDICGSATTGSGKTAAFVLPFLERLMYRNKRVPQTRVLILLPTRELAVQCHSVVQNLAYFTDITCALAVGGLSNKTQETELRKRPDIVVATPGRLIDHIMNAQSFDFSALEILILDEADRLLEMGFIEETREIIKACPKSRQTLLFSATITRDVENLVELSLKDPSFVSVDDMHRTATTLTQEFIRIRDNKDTVTKEAILLSLCTRAIKKGTLVFFKEKRIAHRVCILFTLCGLSAAELHGNLTQPQRLEALESFRDAKVKFLLATDVAARGLDIIGIEHVINFDMPLDIVKYVHRVGRTARAGKSGRAISLITENDRKLLKAIVKKSPSQVKQRVIAKDAIDMWRQKVWDMEVDVKDVLQQEEEEKTIITAEIDATRAENIMLHGDQIKSRPARQWFQSSREKKAIQDNTNTYKKTLTAEEEEEKAAPNRAIRRKMDKEAFNRLPRAKRRRITFEKEAANDPDMQQYTEKRLTRDVKNIKKENRLRKHGFYEELSKSNSGKKDKKKGGKKKDTIDSYSGGKSEKGSRASKKDGGFSGGGKRGKGGKGGKSDSAGGNKGGKGKKSSFKSKKKFKRR